MHGRKTYPSSMSVDEAPIFGPVFAEKLGNRDPEEERKAGDDEVPHGVHVGELKKG